MSHGNFKFVQINMKHLLYNRDARADFLSFFCRYSGTWTNDHFIHIKAMKKVRINSRLIRVLSLDLIF